MRHGEGCKLEAGHKSKHTTVTFTCEICSTPRAGRPFKTETVIVFGEVDDVFHFCFPCVKQAERDARKAEDNYYGI